MPEAKTSLADMSWKEVEEALKRKPVVLIPVGAVEQHGLQTPIGIDNFVAEHFCREVVLSTNAIYLPTTPFGCSQFFSRFTGTIVISPSTLHAYLKDVCVSLLEHGFDHLLFVDNHGGNAPVIAQLAWELRQERSIYSARIFPYSVGKDIGRDLYEDTTTWGHGSEPVVSMAMALKPNDVRMDLAEQGSWETFQGLVGASGQKLQLSGSSVNFYFDQKDVSQTGTKGDPLQASGERGKLYLQRIVEFGIEFINAFEKMDTRIPSAPTS